MATKGEALLELHRIADKPTSVPSQQPCGPCGNDAGVCHNGTYRSTSLSTHGVCLGAPGDAPQ